MKILALLVTYNRCALLGRCLDHVLAQSRKLDGVLVINNGSTDETERMLKERSISFLTQENLGAAAGWHRGIDLALTQGYDAVWLMDDDGYPDVEALRLLEPLIVKGVACASSVVLQENQPERLVFPFPSGLLSARASFLKWPRRIRSLSALRTCAQDGTYPFAHLFNGALISLDAVRCVGNVDQRYFIYGDEVDYFYRLKNYGQVISVLNAMHFHPDVSCRPFNQLKIYYYIKNTLILNSRYYKMVWFRHVLMLILILYRVIMRNGYRFAYSLVAGANSRIFYSALFRGLTGKVGKDYNFQRDA